MRLPALFLALTAFTLPGCAALSLLQGEPDRDVYELRAPAINATQCGRGRIAELVVELPKTRGTLDTERIMIRPSALQTQYLPDATWGEPVPAMLQRLLVQVLGAHDSFSHVGRAPLGVAGDYALISEITDFNAELANGAAIVRLSVDTRMVREMDASIAARGSFAVSAQAASTRSSDLVEAFDAANQQLIAQIRDWSLRAAGINPAGCR